MEDIVPSTGDRKDVSSSGGRARKFDDLPPPGVKVKPKVRSRVPVKKMKDGPEGGDNSNTQYAALGLRACHDAGIIIPKDVIELAIKWWRQCQKDEKDAKAEPLDLKDLRELLTPEKKGSSSTMSRLTAEPQGWCYTQHGDHKAYGSMTAGAIGSLAMYLYIKDNDEGKKKSWKKDKDIHEGLQWMNKNFSVTYNPGPYEHGDKAENSQHQFYYYLYAMERAGVLYGTETFGPHEWYPEGVKVLLEKQKADGSWGSTSETCFAILFLKRATRPLDVATHAAGTR